MKIIHLCLANNVNAGDIALRSAAQEQLRDLWPDAEISLANIDGVLWNQESIEFLNRSADLVVIGPGGIFLRPRHRETRSGWLWDIDKELLSKIKVPLFAYSVGFNIFRGEELEDKFIDTMTTLVEKTTYLTLRHRGGIEAMGSYLPKVLADKIEHLFCPTLTYRWDNGQTLKRKTGKRVGILCAVDRLDSRHKNLEEYLRQMGIVCQYLKKQGYELNYLCHLDKDDWFLKVYDKFDKVIKLNNKDIDTIYDVYDDLDYVIADRGHAQMIGYARGAIVITPSSHSKLDWFFEDIGLSEYSIDESDPELAKKILRLVAGTDRKAWNSKYMIEMRKIIRNHDKQLRKLKKIIG